MVGYKLTPSRISPDETAALIAFKRKLGWSAGEAGIIRTGRRDYGDYDRGAEAGRGVQIRHGVADGELRRPLLEG
jgi:hypothetical protein